MQTKQKLRPERSTMKAQVSVLKAELADAVADADSWKKEATDAEATLREAMRLLGLPAFSDLVDSVKELRHTLEMSDNDKRQMNAVVADGAVLRARRT